MITKFIGSVSDFLNCSIVGFAEVNDNYTLQLDELSSYYASNNAIFNKIKIVTKDNDDEFVVHFSEQERVDFIINYLIMYDQFSNPIGFVNLTQNIDLDKYKIDYITLSFDYTIINKESVITIDVDYASHLIQTSKKEAHLNLFDENLKAFKATSKSELIEKFNTNKIFTKSLLDIHRNSKLLYRYSGSIATGYNYLKTESSSILNEYFTDKDGDMVGYITDIIDVNGLSYYVIWSKNKTTFFPVSDGDPIEILMQIEAPYHIGSNLVLETKYTYDEYNKMTRHRYLHSTADLIQSNLIRLQSVFISANSDEVSIPSKDLELSSEVYVCKDPFNKELILYGKNDSGRYELSEVLTDILNDFGNPKLDDQDIIYASKGFLVTAKIDECYVLSNVRIFNFSLPGYYDNGLLLPNYNLEDENQKFIDDLLDSVDLDFFIPVTKDLIYIRSKGNSYLLETYVGYDYEEDSISYKLKYYNILGYYKYKNLSLIAKNFDHDIVDMSICNFSYNGSLYKLVNLPGSIRISRL